MMASATGTTTKVKDRIQMFGADWCVDCRRAKAVLDQAAVPYDYIDLEADETGAARAESISGQKHIPVIVFPDGAYYVEPTDKELGLKLAAMQMSE
jgi:glutaredoxin